MVFGGNKKKNLKASKNMNGGSRVSKLNRAHLDHLSETEAESGRTDDEDEKSSRGSGRRSGDIKPMTAVNGKQANGKGAKAAGSKSRSPFMPKAIAAMATFAMSGIFHEHITYFTLGFANGENFLFFLANGFATVISTWFKRTYPKLNDKIPSPVGFLMLHAFLLAVCPLCECADKIS